MTARMSKYNRVLQRPTCHNICRHELCNRGPLVTLRDAVMYCQCLGEITPTSILHEDVFEASMALVLIIAFACIRKLKASATASVIQNHFLNYDLKCECCSMKAKKYLRVRDLKNDLKPLMDSTRVLDFCVNIIKIGFKYFYYEPKSSDVSPDYPYYDATKKMAREIISFCALSIDEMDSMEYRIANVLKDLDEGIKERNDRIDCGNCNCCYCAKKRGYYVYGTSPPGRIVQKRKRQPCLPCYPKKISLPAPKEAKRIDKVKYDFSLDWIRSIWNRSDFEYYYHRNIAEDRYDLPELIAKQAENEEDEEEDMVSIERAAQGGIMTMEIAKPDSAGLIDKGNATAEESMASEEEETVAGEVITDENVREDHIPEESAIEVTVAEESNVEKPMEE